MRDATGEKTSITLKAGQVTLQASGARLIEKGFTALYDDQEADEDEQALPRVQVGESFALKDARVEEKRSSAPARYTEGKFVQLMEKAGIGRPSTYGSTLDTLQKRGYVTVRQRQLHVTPLGLLIAGYLMRQVSQLVDTTFTAQMERDLDRIAEGELTRTQYLDGVWKGKLAPAIERAGRESPRVQVPHLEAVFEVRAGQVLLRAQGRSVPLPEGLLPEDLTQKTLADVLNGTFKGKRTKREASTKGTTPRKTRRTAGSSGKASARKGARSP